MRYKELKINFRTPSTEERCDIAVAELAEMGFDSFSPEGDALSAYISFAEYDKYSDRIEAFRREIAPEADTELCDMDDIDWNSVWEADFSPIEVSDDCVVRAPFHSAPDVAYDLVIMPKMSFGTGHHATTCLMLRHILEIDVEGLDVLDMGSGTGVLAILAAKRGARHVDAVDIDEWAAENAKENVADNGVAGIVDVALGDAAFIGGRRYDLILANINRNILLADMPAYAASLAPGGRLIVSGFLGVDCDILADKALSLGFRESKRTDSDGWYSILFERV
ncbi:MAG: 50S ribosomal protein L11 methyltransferase [Rikenellaceae bacterium]|jgi:ribosomal protein L11 methyltransferase|nr:50S ribosomal protein L11 methyltransferase [Rikenellaceae bacterium]